jgi:transketolase
MSINKDVNYTDCRDAVFQEIFALAKKDPRIVVLSADTGAFIFKQFKKELPNQFFYTGITEQNTMSVAAGLARMGRKPFVFGISNFVTHRCLEQIRVDVCGMNLPVTILGTGTGLIYSSDGLTHHITEDVSVMRALPNMQIYSPSDHNCLASLIHTAYRSNSPCYIRFDKGPFVRKYDHDTGLTTFYACFPAALSLYKKSIYIIANGVTVDIALKVREKLLEEKDFSIGVIDVFRLKPFREKELASFLRSRASYLITLEEHNVVGGLGTIIQEFVVQNNLNIPVKVLGIPDTFITAVGDRDYLRKLYGLDVDSVIKCVKENIW